MKLRAKLVKIDVADTKDAIETKLNTVMDKGWVLVAVSTVGSTIYAFFTKVIAQ